MNDSFLFGLFIGCFIGAIGLYHVQKYTDIRKRSEKNRNKRDELYTLFEHYPLFMNLIKNNVINPEYKNIREFFVVDKMAIMNSSTPRLRYDLSEDVLPVLNRLEELGYIEKIPNDSLLYTMHEDFITQLRAPDLGTVPEGPL